MCGFLYVYYLFEVCVYLLFLKLKQSSFRKPKINHKVVLKILSWVIDNKSSFQKFLHLQKNYYFRKIQTAKT